MIHIPQAPTYWLENAHIPTCLLEEETLKEGIHSTPDLTLVDIQITNGTIAQIIPADTQDKGVLPRVDLQRGQIWPCFVDIHTHLDKGHIWERASNPDGTFSNALAVVQSDALSYWNAEDLYRRMEFGLRCSYAHGSMALRTHLDCGDGLAETSLEVFRELRSKWADRLTLQAVCLVACDYFSTSNGEKLADQMSEVNGVLGCVTYFHPDLEQQIDRVFALAEERGLPLDLHVDESGNPQDQALSLVAATTLRRGFNHPIVCDHACSLAVQPPEIAAQTIDLIRQTPIGIISLPMCNLYLQDSQPYHTPRWRGTTLLHELKSAGIPVALASDNCRDPFHGFGDHDMLQVFSLSTRIAHLDRPYGDWPTAVTRTPADLMGLPTMGRIAVGLPANLVLFKGRYFSELLSRPQHDRIVLRQGIAIETALPDYAELDDLIAPRTELA